MKSEPIDAELTPEEAADMLNVSVAYVIGLLDRGEIPCRYVEKADRRIKASNLVAYKRPHPVPSFNAAARNLRLSASVSWGFRRRRFPITSTPSSSASETIQPRVRHQRMNVLASA